MSLTPSRTVQDTRERVYAGIESEKFEHDQSLWVWLTNGDLSRLAADVLKRPCGTTACVAGWASIVAAPEGALVSNGSVTVPGGGSAAVTMFGRQALGITDEAAQTLFYALDEPAAMLALKFLAGNPEATSFSHDDVEHWLAVTCC